MTTAFGIIGSGWRARYFLRLAQAVPDRLRVTGVVSRSTARAAELTAQWGVPAGTSIDELDRSDFVLVSVPRQAAPAILRELVARATPGLVETPPAEDLPGLRGLWADLGGTGLVQVAEQYLRTPGHAARLALLRTGTVGAPTSVQVSSTHLHHAASLLRGLLGVGCGPAEVCARRFVAPLHDPLTRAGWSTSEARRDVPSTVATVDFGGRVGLYDCTDNQWRNPLRTNRIVIRAERGEMVDDEVVRLAEPGTVLRSPLRYERTGLETVLTGLDLRHISLDGRVVYRNPFAGTGLADDDVAVADLVERTGAWARDEGPAPYPLADGCQDHLIGLAIEESARTGRPVTTTHEPWAG